MSLYKLIKKYPGSPELGTIAEKAGDIKYTYPDGKESLSSSSTECLFEKLIVNQPEYWEKVVEKDYEILSYYNPDRQPLIFKKYHPKSTDKSWFCEDDMYINITSTKYNKIYSVKRLSDGEVFTIGDLCNPIGEYSNNKHKITNIEICKAGYLRISSSNYYMGINSIEHSKKPLFTTEDGVDIFEGDKYFELALTFEPQFREAIYECTGRPNINYDYNTLKGKKKLNEAGRYYFSTKETAEEYIFYNKPVLSLKEVGEIYFTAREEKLDRPNHQGTKLHKIVREKLKEFK